MGEAASAPQATGVVEVALSLGPPLPAGVEVALWLGPPLPGVVEWRCGWGHRCPAWSSGAVAGATTAAGVEVAR
jgi:hypothetical protein